MCHDFEHKHIVFIAECVILASDLAKFCEHGSESSGSIKSGNVFQLSDCQRYEKELKVCVFVCVCLCMCVCVRVRLCPHNRLGIVLPNAIFSYETEYILTLRHV